MGPLSSDSIDGPLGCDSEVSYSSDHPTPSRPPTFVVTHQVPARPRHSGFTYVTTGIEAALTRAREAAGEREVVIMGGASVIAQALTARLGDRIRLHLSPVPRAAGTPRLQRTDEPI